MNILCWLGIWMAFVGHSDGEGMHANPKRICTLLRPTTITLSTSTPLASRFSISIQTPSTKKRDSAVHDHLLLYPTNNLSSIGPFADILHLHRTSHKTSPPFTLLPSWDPHSLILSPSNLEVILDHKGGAFRSADKRLFFLIVCFGWQSRSLDAYESSPPLVTGRRVHPSHPTSKTHVRAIKPEPVLETLLISIARQSLLAFSVLKFPKL